MDEFVHYHALGCATADLAGELPLIRDGCSYHDLRLPLTATYLPLRSYVYIGSLPAVPFYPFWRALQDPVAARVQGAVFFLLWVWLARRLLLVQPGSLVVASLIFPVFLATFLVDEGPVGLSALLVLAALLAARRAADASGGCRAAAWAALAGFALFLGLWVKLVFGWWLPAFAVFALEEARRRSPSVGVALSRRRGAVIAGLLALLLPTLVLLASVDRDGRPYVAALRWSGVSAEPEAVESIAARVGAYVTNGSLLAPRNVVVPPSPVDVLPAILSAGILALGFARGAGRRRELAGWVVLAALTFGLVAASGHSRWPHHFAFPLLLLVMGLAVALDALGRRGRLVAGALVLAFWASLAARLPAASVPLESSREKDRLLAFVREEGLDRRALQVHASWGTYYVAQLFGDSRRMVLYLRSASDDPARLAQFRDVARARGRSLLLVSSRRWERLHTAEVESVLGPPLRAWRFGAWWAVEYAPSLTSARPSPRP
jgi:hypothetical protein